MIVLYIFISIIAIILLLLCIRVTVVLDYDETFVFYAKYLFIRYDIYPKKEKKIKEEKPPKKDDTKKAAGKKKEEKKKSGILKNFYINQGFLAVLELLGRTERLLSGMFGRVFRAVVVKNFYVKMSVAGGDAAKTAIDYGKTCATVFPAAGAVCSVMRVRKYDVTVRPDFLQGESKAKFNAVIAVVPLRIAAAAVAAAAVLLFGILPKLYFGSRKPKDITQIQKGKAV